MATEPEYVRCEWRMPEDAKNASGCRCLAEAEHDGGHVVYMAIGGSLWLYEVREAERRLLPLLHADWRGRKVPSEAEAEAVYVVWLAVGDDGASQDDD